MRLIGLKSVKPGDVLSHPVCTSSGKVILNAGVALSEGYIEKLKQIGIHKIYINDGRFEDIEITQTLDLRTKNEAIQVIKDTYDNLHKAKPIDEYLIKEIAKNIVEYIRDSKQRGVSILSMDAIDEYIIEHSINVAILTAFLGNNMSVNFNQLCDMVTGALIHDIGRDNIKEEKPDHVQKGFDVMRKLRGFSLHSSIVCFEHHEKFDGSGYPRKIKGSGISEFSRVITVADFYDNLLHGYDSDLGPLMPHEAFEGIMAEAGFSLDPAIVELFRDTIIFYPNGCTVLLSNGLKGVIVKQNLGSPQRPIVRIFNDTGIIGEIDLLKSLTITIKEVIVA